MDRIQDRIDNRFLGRSIGNRMVSTKGFVDGDGVLGQWRANGPTCVALTDDFLGDVVADLWNYTEGTDTGTANGAISEGVNGVFLLTAGDSAGTVAADGAQLNSALNWKASSGNLVFEARVKLAAITTVTAFLGFTDTKSLEAPATLSGTTYTTNATDAVGVLFDTNATTDTWRLVGVANDVDATHYDTGLAPVADTYETWRIEVDTAGAATFYRNGTVITKLSGAVTASVALTPVFLIFPEGAVAGRTMSIDFVHVSCDRV